MIKILGISGSRVENGNTQALLGEGEERPAGPLDSQSIPMDDTWQRAKMLRDKSNYTEMDGKEPNFFLRKKGPNGPPSFFKLHEPIKNDLKNLLDDDRPLSEQAKTFKTSPLTISRMIERLEKFNGEKLDGTVKKNRMATANIIRLRIIPEWLKSEKQKERLSSEGHTSDKRFAPLRRLPNEDEIYNIFSYMLDRTYKTWFEDKMVDMSFIYSNFKKIQNVET